MESRHTSSHGSRLRSARIVVAVLIAGGVITWAMLSLRSSSNGLRVPDAAPMAPVQGSPAAVTNAPTAATESLPVANSPVGTEPIEPGDARKYAYQSRSLAQLLAAAQQLPAGDRDMAFLLEVAHLLCMQSGRPADERYVELRARNLAPGGARGLESFREHARQASQYCRGYSDAGQRAIIERLLEAAAAAAAGPEDAEIDRISNLPEDQRSSEEAIAELWRMIDLAKSPINAYQAAQIAADLGSGRFSDLDESLVGTRLLDRAQSMRHAGAYLALCERSDGCGPGTLLAMDFCSAYSVCRPGASVADSMALVYSPVELAYVREAANRLRPSRQSP